MKWVVLMLAVTLGSCTGQRRDTATLYRNSSMDDGVRVHFATFDADESDPNFNINNCQMASRLLNANIDKLNGGTQTVGFWCESGPYRAAGYVPAKFEAQFPVD